MMKKLLIGAVALAVVGAALFLAFPVQMMIYGGLARSFLLNVDAPPGTTQTSTNPEFKSPAPDIPADVGDGKLNPLFAHLDLGKEAGTVSTEAHPDLGAADAVERVVSSAAPTASADWPSYNRTLTSERFSPLSQIDTNNVGQLKVLCTYDT
jgi:alcohol dehydrogenase (cytochrome c)